MSNPFCYVELHTDALKGASKFYQKVFDWKPKAAPGMEDYMTFQPAPKSPGGGMGSKQDPRMPNHWLPYVQVDDVKKTMAKAVKAGATSMLPYMEIGANMGSIGIFMDPTGAPLGIWAAPRPAKVAKKKVAKKKVAEKKVAKETKTAKPARAAKQSKAGKSSKKKSRSRSVA